jgi:hypothetical protein
VVAACEELFDLIEEGVATRQLDGASAELRWMWTGHSDSFSRCYHLSAGVRFSGGCSRRREGVVRCKEAI